jgi:hypothetical protein
MGIGKCVNTMN